MERTAAKPFAISLSGRLPVFRAPNALARLVIGVLSGAALVALGVVAAAGVSLEVGGFLRFAVLALGMLLLAGWCRMRNLDPRMADAATIVAAGTLSLMLCGLISNLGLALGAPLVDPYLAASDARLGMNVEQVVRWTAGHAWLIDGLTAAYNTSGVAVVVLITAAFLRGARRTAWSVAATCFVAMQVVATLSIAFPAIGAMAHLDMLDLQGAGLPRGAGVYHLGAFEHFRAGPVEAIKVTDLSGLVTFPSFHTVLALLAAQALWDTRLRWAGAVWTAVVIASTVPIGGHYVTDLAAGCLIWLSAALLVRRALLSSP